MTYGTNLVDNHLSIDPNFQKSGYALMEEIEVGKILDVIQTTANIEYHYKRKHKKTPKCKSTVSRDSMV